MNHGQAWDAVLAIVRARRGEDFTANDFSKYLAMTRQSGHAWLRRFVSDGRLVAVGQGRATRYRLAPPPAAPRPLARPRAFVSGAPSNTTVSVWGTAVRT